jgi:hypothetical protein
MKIGRITLWADHITEQHYLNSRNQSDHVGADLREDAHYHKLRRKLDELQLKTSTVTVATAGQRNQPGSSDPESSRGRLKTIVANPPFLARTSCVGRFAGVGVFRNRADEEEFNWAADVHGR